MCGEDICDGVVFVCSGVNGDCGDGNRSRGMNEKVECVKG